MAQDRRAGSQVRRTGVIVVIVLAIAFVVAQTSPLVRTAFKPLRAGMDDIVVQTEGTLHGVKGWSFGESARLKQEIERLRVENRQLAIWRDASISMNERMRRYEELLDLVGEPLPNGVSARVVTETDGPFADTRLANAGARNGVEIGHVAINTQGVVGRVIRVGNRSSRILLVSDLNSRVPVMGEISGVRAIMSGGTGDEFAQLVDKPERDDFIVGETLLTTGEGNAFPRGLRVGVAVRQDTEWRARLALSEAPLDFVRILPSLSIPAPEDDPIPASETPDEIAVSQAEGPSEPQVGATE